MMANGLRRVNTYTLSKIKQWEGLKLSSYQDTGGIWTIGYGHTSAAGYPHVSEGMCISKEEAEAILINDLRQFESCVQSCVQVPLNDNQFGALVSFCYNVGIKRFTKSTLLKKLNRSEYNSIPSELKRWNKVNGKVCNGLSKRRSSECNLWLKELPYETKSKEKEPESKSNFNPDIITSVIGSLSGLGGLLTGNGIMQYAFAFIMVAAALFAMIIIGRRYWDAKA